MLWGQGINYSAGRAIENGMWGPSATPQDVGTPVNTPQGSGAQNFRERRGLPNVFFGKDFVADGWGSGQQDLWWQTPFQEHHRADDFGARARPDVPEDREYSGAHFHWPG